MKAAISMVMLLLGCNNKGEDVDDTSTTSTVSEAVC